MAYISKVKLPNNSEYLIKDKEAHYYGVCSTANNVAVKSVTISGFELVEGVRISVKFENENIANNPSLSINGGTAIPIKLEYGNIGPWNDGEIVDLIYNNNKWNIVNYSKIEVIHL